MSAPRRRQAHVSKIQEFYAHDAHINTVSIGRKSSAVIATGGDDQLVKIWKLGKITPLMTLDGHSTEVDSVLFDVQEALVAAGSRGGSLKVWDLAAGKILRTMPGHRSSVKCLDFHPYGDYFASGSQDTNLKIFDIRKKGCMQTYKGHGVGVSCVRHSPDGRWIVSGDVSGVVKVWDLTSGKLINELKLAHKDAVVSVDFHPNEFLLAVGGEHATTFWDMESFEAMGATPKESATVRSVAFSKDGRALLSATSDTLKSWSWEPDVGMQDCIDAGWGSVSLGGGGGAPNSGVQVLADMAEGHVPGQEMIGVTRMKTVLAIYVCDISNMKPFDVPMDEQSDPGAYESLLATMERVSLSDQQDGASAAPAAVPASISPVRPSILHHPRQDFFDAHAGAPEVAVPSKPNPYAKLAQAQAAQPAPSPAQPVRHFQPAQPAQPFVPSHPAPATSNSYAQPAAAAASASSAYPSHPHYSASGLKVSQGTDMTQQHATPAAAAAAAPSSSGLGIDPAQLPGSKFDKQATSAPSASPTAAAAAAAAAAAVAAELASQRKKVEDDHKYMVDILSRRAAGLAKLSALWQSSGGSLGGAKRCIEFLVATNDNALSVDFLNFAEDSFARGGVLTLDMARDLLPLLKQLLTDKFESYAHCALRYVRMLLLHFTPVIQSCRSSSSAPGVDLQRDERVTRANECYGVFKVIYDTAIAPIAKRDSPIGELAKDTRAHLEKLLWTKP